MSVPASQLPAILGGPPVRAAGPPPWPVPDPEVLAALQRAYADRTWGVYYGPHVERLEEDLARLHGVAHALACCSGTFAIELALRSLRVSAGDEVILAAYDYGGNFLSVLAVGAMPVLVDVDPENWNLSPDLLDQAITPRTRAIIMTHLHGGVVPARVVVELARRRGVPVIEDAAQMPGAIIDGRRAGTWGDVATLSFGGSKLLTAGRGGCLLTNSREFHQRAKLHGHRANRVFPLAELQAAVLLPQLAKLDQRNRTRAQNVQLLSSLLAEIPGLRPLRNRVPDTEPGYYKVGFQFDSHCWAGLSRDRLIEAIRAEGVAIDAGFRSLHVGRSASRFRAPGRLDQAQRAHHNMLVLHHPVLLESADAMHQIKDAVHKVYVHREELKH